MSECVAAKVPGLCPISFLNNLDICDLELYKHPPFMWTLWYISLFGKFVYDKVKEMLENEGGDEDEGGDDGKKEKEKEKEKEDKGEDEEGAKEEDEPEEAPAEEEEEEAPAEEAPAEEEG